jgi:CubicO group peptidase (beta-lactamase class C family)
MEDDVRSSPLSRALAEVERGRTAGDHVGAQLYVSRNGCTVADLGLGEARAGVPLTPDHLVLWMSSVKPVTAVALAQQWERGRLDLDDPVMRHLPAFGAGGKESVTLRHCLTHTAGIPGVALPWTPERSFEAVLDEVCAAPLAPGWVPGRDCGYHTASAWYALAAVVERCDGRPFSRYVREEVFSALGEDDAWIGLPAERHRAYGPRIAPMHEGAPHGPRVHPYAPWAGHAEGCAMVRPGGNGWGPARVLGRLYEALLDRGAGRAGRLLGPETVEALTSRHLVGRLDRTFGVRLDRGLGFVLDSKRHGPGADWYGPHASERTFGHAGYRSSVAFADPEAALVVALVWNGMVDEARHAERVRRTLSALYEDLGLVPVGVAEPGVA